MRTSFLLVCRIAALMLQKGQRNIQNKRVEMMMVLSVTRMIVILVVLLPFVIKAVKKKCIAIHYFPWFFLVMKFHPDPRFNQQDNATVFCVSFKTLFNLFVKQIYKQK